MSNSPKILTLLISTPCLKKINEYIANHPPERGGALLGPVGRPIVTDVILDSQALTTGASYHPSLKLTEYVQQVEKSQPLEFKGVIHSHPSSLDRPSGPDEIAMEEGLKLNPHMPYFVAPIVTMQRDGAPPPPHRGDRRQLSDYELPLGLAKISFYIAYRSHGDGVRLKAVPVEEISEEELTQTVPTQPSGLEFQGIRLRRDLENICHTFGSNIPPEIFVTEIEKGILIPAGRVILNGGLELLFLINNSYPYTSPIVLVTPPEGKTEEVQIPWSLEISESGERLVTALQRIIRGNGPYQRVYGPLGKFALTADGDRAGLAGWSPFYSGCDPKSAATEMQQALFARSQGLLSEHISKKRVLIAGTGSVGSYCAEQLTRSGVGAFTLIDPENVEVANLCRTTYEIQDLERPKVEALAKRLLNINPLVEVTLHSKGISDFEVPELDALVEQVDLVIATTDDPDAQRILNRFAYFHKKPALFVGLYKGAEGGEVIFTVPEHTPCYRCATSIRHQAENDQGQVSAEVDYGTGRLVAEVALAADIHHVTSVAVKMALSLLLPKDAQAKLKGFLNPKIDEGSNFLTLSMVPDYWFYPQLFADTPGQYAYQSIWLKPQRQEQCSVCGNVHHRIDPRTTPLRKPKAVDGRD